MFQNVVFAGGGSRCVWQMGFCQGLQEHLQRVSCVSASSAGAAIACILFSQRADDALFLLKDAAGSSPKGIQWQNLANDQAMFPVSLIYRRLLREMITHESLETLRSSGPEIRVLIGRHRTRLHPALAFALGVITSHMQKKITGHIHTDLWRKLGFYPELITFQDCQNHEEAIQLLLASSASPPMTPHYQWNGRIALDGTVIDNVPLLGIESTEPTLVLLSRKFRKIPASPHVAYAYPSEELPPKWDFDCPSRLQRTYDLGRQDAATFLTAQQQNRAKLTATGQRAVSPALSH